MSNEIALRFKLGDFLSEYEEKKAALSEQLEKFQAAGEALKMGCTVHGTYGRERIEVGSIGYDEMDRNLRRSAWLTIYEAPGVKVVMSAKDQQRFEQFVAKAPDFTLEEIKAQFGDLIMNPWANILRGLAEVFSDLDQAFKSHERVKIGVNGLPKRIVITGFGGFSGYGWSKLKDVVNAIASYRSEALLTEWEMREALRKDGRHFMEERGIELRLFQNGNGHLHFSARTLKDVNRALAEFYGDVLPDAYTPRPTERQQSTEVSKDLQYYPTPRKVVDRILSEIYIKSDELVLEPSCGCGRFLDGLKERFPSCKVIGVEVDAGRVEEARKKGHSVFHANFLEMEPARVYDRVIMNPPFYGKHYAKHVEHALKFLKEDGVLYAVLPVTARTDHGLIEKMRHKCQWSDLPVCSFRESGTNINTTLLTMRAAA